MKWKAVVVVAMAAAVSSAKRRRVMAAEIPEVKSHQGTQD